MKIAKLDRNGVVIDLAVGSLPEGWSDEEKEGWVETQSEDAIIGAKWVGGGNFTRPIEVVEPPTIDNIKMEAGKRILRIYPEFKQRNMISRAVELTNIGNTREMEELENIQKSWDWIKAVRDASTKLENMPNGVPNDYRNDKYWPANPEIGE